MSIIGVLRFNKLLFGNESIQNKTNNQYKAYDLDTVVYILEYQKEFNLSNTEISIMFSVSRNTITRWKKLCLI